MINWFVSTFSLGPNTFPLIREPKVSFNGISNLKCFYCGNYACLYVIGKHTQKARPNLAFFKKRISLALK